MQPLLIIIINMAENWSDWSPCSRDEQVLSMICKHYHFISKRKLLQHIDILNIQKVQASVTPTVDSSF